MSKSTDTAGNEAILNEENKDTMFRLPIIQHIHDEVRIYILIVIKSRTKHFLRLN
jgi:hypothetical protein